MEHKYLINKKLMYRNFSLLSFHLLVCFHRLTRTHQVPVAIG